MQGDGFSCVFEAPAKRKKPVVFCGDLNVAAEEIDLKNPKTNRKMPDLLMKSDSSTESIRIYRCSGIFIRIRRNLFLVVIPVQRKKEERRVAY